MKAKLFKKDPYSKTRFVSVHIRGYVDLLRPFTLLAPFIVSMCIVTASLIYANTHHDLPIPAGWWVTVGQASFTLALVNAASNALNQATDHEADAISKPYRPIPRGIVKPDEAQSLAYIFYLFALLRSVTISPIFGLFVFLIMVFTVTYSLPPRMKQHLFINQIWIAIPRGLFGILAAWSVFGNPFQPMPLIIGGIATVFLIGGMATKDIVDCVADKRTGTRTLVNTFGAKKTALISFPFMFFPFTIIPIMISKGFLDAYLWPLFLLIFLSCLVFYFMMRESESESETLENTHAWALMYIEYMIFALGFSLLVILSNYVELPTLF